MDINKGFAIVALCAFLSACAPSPHGRWERETDKPALRGSMRNTTPDCTNPGDVTGMEYYQSTRQAYLDSGMDDEMSTYLAHTATSMMTCIWQHEFSRFAGRTCSVELDFTGTPPAKYFSGDPAFCAFIRQQIAPLPLSAPPAAYLKQHKNLSIDFTPG